MNLELIGINIKVQNKIYSMINIYLPSNSNINKNELELLKNKLENDFVLAKVNAHHEHWNSQS